MTGHVESSNRFRATFSKNINHVQLKPVTLSHPLGMFGLGDPHRPTAFRARYEGLWRKEREKKEMD
jgi:hypothetical protein